MNLACGAGMGIFRNGFDQPKEVFWLRMIAWPESLQRIRRRRQALLILVMLAYVGLLLQPCAMAMGEDRTAHPSGCHHQPNDGGAPTHCLSQPAAECSTGAWNVDTCYATSAKFKVYLTPILLPSPAKPEICRTEVWLTLDHGPPPGQPAFNLRNCVFLI